ncbi:MAG: hypothetical protein ABSF00_09665 [Candidatus Bathyarchaeia archaeon]
MEKQGLTLTDSQFKELRTLLQCYIKAMAIGAIQKITDDELWKNAWLLSAAGYDQFEISKILHTSQPTISRILSGKYSKKKVEQ